VIKLADFFEGIDQVELSIEGKKGRFPVFYRDARMFTIVLPANILKLYKALPDPRFTPTQILPGIGGISLTAFEYFDTDIEPYNEFSIGIMLNSPYWMAIPGYNLSRQYISRMFNVFIYHLPVTTEIALRGGIEFYNYPKFLADIIFSDSPDRISCELSRDGERILSISGPKVPTVSSGEMKFMCNLYHYRQPQLAEFKVNVIEGAVKMLPADVAWSFSLSSAIGRDIHSMVVGSRALMYMYMPKIQCILYGPEHMPMPLMQKVLTTKGFLPEVRTPAKKAAAKKAAGKKPAGKKAAR